MATLVGKSVTNNGLGLSNFTLPGKASIDEVIFPVLRAALEAGNNVWSGADFYGVPTSNSLHLMARYFTAFPEDADKVVLCIKSGVADMRTFSLDCSRTFLRSALQNCNAILDGKKKIDLFGAARVDPSVPVEETIKVLGEMVDDGLISGILMSEVAATTIRRASKVHTISMVEAEVSLWSPEIFSNGVLETCQELGIVVCGHTPLGAGTLTGKIKTLDDLEPNDFHRHFPRFQPDVFQNNLELVGEVEKLAMEKRSTVAQLALSWVKANGVIPIAGARSVERIRENAVTIELTNGDLERIERILKNFPIQGARYPGKGQELSEY